MIKSFISKDFEIKKLPWFLIRSVGFSSNIILDEAVVNEQLIMKFVSKSRMFPGAIKIIFWGSDWFIFEIAEEIFKKGFS